MITFPQLNHKGRLGNQLFQIASTIGVGKTLGHAPCFPDWEYAHCFKNKLPSCVNQKGQSAIAITEKFSGYSEILKESMPPSENFALNGYFQSEKYFKDAEEEVRKAFEFSDDIKEYIQNKYSHLLEAYDTSIHVRRGDYLNLKHIYHTLSHLYYFKATSVLLIKKAVIFSDDIEWCKTIFKPIDCVFINEREHDSYQISYTETAEQNAKKFTTEDVTELALMSMFKNNIISNSTFSWWAAWLNSNPKKQVIAPSLWYSEDRVQQIISPEKRDGEYINDLIPISWTKV